MGDVPWFLVFCVIAAGSVFVAGVWLNATEFMYIGVGGFMGLACGTVETLAWVRRLDRKYKQK